MLMTLSLPLLYLFDSVIANVGCAAAAPIVVAVLVNAGVTISEMLLLQFCFY